MSVTKWPRYPTIYEINTWVWLSDLSEKYGTSINLSSIPSADWDAIAGYGFDAVWLMGVWERSPAGIAIANRNENLLDDFRRALPDFCPQDNVGSPYCVRRYVADEHLGGFSGLAIARQELAKRSIRLVLDFVPNHVAPDHPWAVENPEYFVQGKLEDIRRNPASWIQMDGSIYACGRDPYFPPWPDVLQLNAFQSSLRQTVVESISDIANQCDGIRCDMAMLFLNTVFGRTWGQHTGQYPTTEYWADVITTIKKTHPEFIFIAEAYWDTEWELQQNGFDFCYDKKLYDRLEHGSAETVQLHLSAGPAYQEKVLRFLENHDEPRAAATFSLAREQAAAVAISSLPGARLFHEGQFEGRKVRLPVFLGRRPRESTDKTIQAFYKRLLAAINAPIFRHGEWRLCKCNGWPGNPSFQNLVAWSWVKDNDRRLIVINLSDIAVQGHVQVPRSEIRGQSWRLADVLSDVSYDRDGDGMWSPGLYVELGPWKCHFFQCSPIV